MGIIKYKPVTPGRRGASVDDFADITTDRPYKPLTYAHKRTGGRNAHGHITSHWRGGGHKQRVRIVDFKRQKFGVPAEVLTIEYDPIRTARIALIQYEGGEKAYITAPLGLKVGDKVMSGPDAEVKPGNHLPLEKIPSGTPIHNIELAPGQGGRLVRAAGDLAMIISKETEYVHVKLPSGEVRMIPAKCMATVGQCSNPDHGNISLGKAGRKRWMGISPHVRGAAMNPVDHPMGGTSGGLQPRSPWGQKAKGLKTRARYKKTNRFIVKDRRS
jgi:large subunit ribosomal protein L2